jgi:hypothetical protein
MELRFFRRTRGCIPLRQQGIRPMSVDSRSNVTRLVPQPRRQGLRSWARNSPWVMIAALLHVLLIAILSMVVFRAQRRETSGPATTVVIAQASRELPPAIEEGAPLFERDKVPPLAAVETGIVDPVELVLPDASAGRAGERTDDLDPTPDPGHFDPDPAELSELPSGATGGTPIGVGTAGHRSTGTSAFSSRVAGGAGPGGGGAGQEGGGRPGGVPPPEIVLAALEWLRVHQASDGSWDCDGFMAQCRQGACDGAGSAAHDVGVTGLALLAFLGAGATHAEGPYRETVKDGLQWLLGVQDEEGCFGERIGQGFLYDHACATLAMVEAYGMTQAKPLRGPAQKAIRFILSAQNPYSAWRYAAPGDGDNDTSVTGWMGMALKSAKLAGLTIDDQAFENALAWIDQMTDPVSGRTGYTDTGGMPSRTSALVQRFPPRNSESMTAVGVLLRIFGGRTRQKDPFIDRGADLLDACLPRWSSESGHIDFYYWYYGTLAMFQVGGPRWARWNEAIQSAILAHQRVDASECAWGSWDPLDPWSASGGRVYATALNCLCMEVYYRYPRVFGVR